jgi:sugar O-acyltransferase (sialic acid O-acetyltransferase NeuD family)
MIIIGAKGFAKEVLEVLNQLNDIDNLVFYDDINLKTPEFLYDRFSILKSISDAQEYFKTVDKRFTIGIGNPILRKKLYDKFSTIGGKFVSTISPSSSIGSYEVEIGFGSNVLSGAIFSNSTKIGMGCIIYYNVIITHDCKVGDFVELSPNVNLLGNVEVGSYTHIGSNATILPNIKIGKNVIIGAGALVTKDLPDNCVAIGIPAKIIKELNPLDF